MWILPQSARKTKSEFFGKREWALHSALVYIKDIENNKLDIHVFDHWSNNTRQDALFTASSLHMVLETISPRPKWVTIMSDNEAGEAKTAIDSHHAQISQAIKRYIKLGSILESGKDIEIAIKNINRIYVANLTPNRSQDGDNVYARELPKVGEFKKFSPAKIQKIKKGRKIDKPKNEVFYNGWALKSNKKVNNKDPWKRMSEQVKKLLENMFHTGTVNSNQKLSAQQMREELLQHVQNGELEESDVPKVTKFKIG
ncbi:hypothetical protein C2G38_2221234 [Gigaspora rosea]|uniref:Uncharacterized protein n=1 Tax=Gigaspora rosea TaxID=44941 RepID=A0A397U6Z3_9GLOM|nr:hypothetical protein C2G38_2221234 [Gigaspora rosea]